MLKRKMFRDIKFNLSQFVTIFIMIFMGVMVYSGIRSYMDGMSKTADVFYEQNNLQDLEAVGENFTDEDLEKAKNIEHVKNAERRLTLTGTMVSNEDRTLQLNFIEENEISKFYVIDGKEFNKETKGAWLDYYYARNNDLKVGDKIKIKYDGLELEEEIIGLINVPDHVYDIKDDSALFPNHIDYGFCYLSVNELPLNKIYNYMIIDVDNEENKTEVKNKIEENIADAKAVTDIKDNFSY